MIKIFRNTFVNIIFLTISFSTLAQTYKPLVEEGDRLQNTGQFTEAIAKFREAEFICHKETGFYTEDMRYIVGSMASCAQSLDDYNTFIDCLIKIDSISHEIGYQDDVAEDFLCLELCNGYLWRATSDDIATANKYFERGKKASESKNNKEMIDSWELIKHRLNYINALVNMDLSSAAPILEAEYKYFIHECKIPRNELLLDIQEVGMAWATNLMDRIYNEESLNIINECDSIIKTAQPDFYSLQFDTNRMYALSNMSRDAETVVLGEEILSKNQENEENIQLITSVKYNLGRGYNGIERYEDGYKILKSIYNSPYAYLLKTIDTNFVKSEMAYSLYGLGMHKESKEMCKAVLNDNPSGTTLVQTNFILGLIANKEGNKYELGYLEDYLKSHESLGYKEASYAESMIELSKRFLNNYQLDKALEIINRSVNGFETNNDTSNIDYYIALSLQALIYIQKQDLHQSQNVMNKLNNDLGIIQSLVSSSNSQGSTVDYDKISCIFENVLMATYYGFAVGVYEFKKAINNDDLTTEQKQEVTKTINTVQKQIFEYVESALSYEDLYLWLKNNNLDRLGNFYHIQAITLRDINNYDECLNYIDKVMNDIPRYCSYFYVLDELKNFIKIEINAREMHDYIASHYAEDISRVKDMINAFTSNQRNNMWQQYYGNISNYAKYAHWGNNMAEINKIAYNSVLVSKGLMLTSDIDFETRILRSDNKSVLKKYREWKAEVAQASDKALSLERELVRMIGPSDNNEAFRYTWEDVRSNLKQGEYAIEFRAYEDFGINQYLAFIIGSDYESPVLVELCKCIDLHAIGSGDSFDFNGLSALVWSKFDKIIPKGSTVYFSPDLQLHSFPLENLPDFGNADNIISDRWKLYRISSTRQITQKGQTNSHSGVDIYGGADYSFERNELIADYNNNLTSYRNVSDNDESLRGSVSTVRDLPGSKREVATIASLLNDRSTTVKSYIGKMGTESRFKAFAGKEGNVLHISTHGFFIKPTDKGNRRLSNLLSLNNAQTPSYNDALKSSGLMMAGVNEVILGRVSPTECEDGLLTAQEISQMDLSKIDFVILSACETGVGAVSGDGVFGLQRGFKLAGVKSIMMSLWKVDDNATEKLMTEFYRNWIEHKNAIKALYAAQKTVRNTPGWEHPKYWAGFIMLDSLN